MNIAFQWLISQLPGILIGIIVVVTTGFINEFFTKRTENRAEKYVLLDKINSIISNAEDENWGTFPSKETHFKTLLQRLSKYNLPLSDELVNNYSILWGGVSVFTSRPSIPLGEEERTMLQESIVALREMNEKFQEYAYPDKKVKRRLRRLRFYTIYKIKKFLTS